MSVRLISGKPAFPQPNSEEHKFADLLKGREAEFPLLTRAVSDSVPATSVRIEWLDKDGVVLKLRENWTQIVRFPYDDKGAAEGSAAHPDIGDEPKEESLTKFLAVIERILEFGKPSRKTSPPISTCGGFRHFLGRDLNEGDRLILRPLREPLWRRFTHIGYDREDGPVPMETPMAEWLAEFSLQVVPAA